MRDIVNSYVRKFKEERQNRRKAAGMLLALALLVVAGVSWQLHFTGIALTNETYCGLEEHQHSEACYEKVLVCGLEESDDTSETSESHIHTDDCYEEQEVLVCGLEEHTHTVECLSDNTADVETASDWAETLPDMTGVLADDVVAIAQSQLGYKESTKNYILTDDGETKQGYTRYGAWYGEGFEYVDWDAMFASFCLYYAGVDETVFPLSSGAYAWMTELSELGYYEDATDAEAAAGSLVFFDGDGSGRAGRVGIVTEVNENDSTLTVIEGDYTDGDTDSVCENTYSVSDSTLLGYAALPKEAAEASPMLTSDGETNGTTLSYVTDETIVVVPEGYTELDVRVLKLEVANGTVTTPETDDDVYPADYYSYLTGETLELDFSIYGGQDGDYVYRIYFEPMDLANIYGELFKDGAPLSGQSLKEQISLAVSGDGMTITSGDFQSYFNWDEAAGAYYIEFQVDQSKTAGGQLRITYPSRTTPGGELAIYGAIYEYDTSTGEIGALASDSSQAFLASWTTKEEEFKVTIDNSDQKPDGLILSVDEDGKVYVAVTNRPYDDITWTIEMTDLGVSSESLSKGEDLVMGITVTDTITLPDGIEWTGVVESVNVDGDSITFTDASGVTLLTLKNESSVDAGNYGLVYDSSSNTLTVTWEIYNTNTDDNGFVKSEISNSDWEVNLNGDYLTYSDSDGSAFKKAESHVIENTVVYDFDYTWAENAQDDSTATISILTSDGGVILNKTADRSAVYMGEDAYYTISLYNQGTAATKDLVSLNDSALSNGQYISPENIWKMFFPETAEETDESLAENSGDYLTITITDAWVYYNDTSQELDAMVDIDGNEGNVYLTNANYKMSVPEHYAKYQTLSSGGTKK
ncbi:MAG: hypothetical protein LUH07_03440 [Lachnospiraceae bacterium]|nr:hypothetical protein [Lachnospiraceae bacterium]